MVDAIGCWVVGVWVLLFGLGIVALSFAVCLSWGWDLGFGIWFGVWIWFVLWDF